MQQATLLYQELLQSVEKYFKMYMQGLRETYCMARRNIASLLGQHTNNYAEVTVRLFKDNILSRCKACNSAANGVTSAGSCERNWSTFEFIHPKKRNKLACGTVRNIVQVHCNLCLIDNIETIGHSDANIDWSSSDEDLDWLAGVNFYELYYFMNFYELLGTLF